MAATGGIAAAALISGYMSSQAAQSAADTQADAANNASNQSMAMYQQQRQDAAPWRESGVNALSQLNQQLPNLTRNFSRADFQNDPGYQFTMDEGMRAIENSAAARGGIGGTATLNNLTRLAQGTASGEYNNAYNRFTNNQTNTYNKLSNLAGMGQTANQGVANAGTNAANQIGQNMIGAGNAQAAGIVGGANAINQGVGTGINTWMQQQYLNRIPIQQSAPSGTQQISSGGAMTGYGGNYNNALGTYEF